MTAIKLLRIHPTDNVAVAIKSLSEGETAHGDGLSLCTKLAIPFGHKVAAQAIAKGDIVFKYGAPIGLATKHIEAGDHVHIHNMESLYMKQFTK